ncbi:MAG: FAD-dependent oxidoreductase, partial [Xanthomonadales bacterium]|nr:FAD-dependent oxidoreductase [Xanthomonadales bacterium]
MAEQFDIIVIGSGAAGLSAALAARGARVAVVTRGVIGLDGASCWAQGGLAAAIGPGDSPGQHALDTIKAGHRRNNKAAVRWMAESAPETVRWLIDQGVEFDRIGPNLSLGRESAHTFPRIVHAGGDATGAELMRALRQAVQVANHVQLFEFCSARELIKLSGKVVGVAITDARGEGCELYAPHVVLATGGLGQLFLYTTNPTEADGSGLALAMRVGAELADMEMVQFHPTALAPREAGQGEQLPLITEAVRGAGAWLVNEQGQRFLSTVHPQAELAPRDVVARAVWEQTERGRRVYLDATPLGESLRTRFPTLVKTCQMRNIDPRRDPIPVVPAAHYHMGGIKVDLHSMSSVPGLYAVGEVACSGVHGVNRLASNSLLEGVAFGRALGDRLARMPRQQQLPTVSLGVWNDV